MTPMHSLQAAYSSADSQNPGAGPLSDASVRVLGTPSTLASSPLPPDGAQPDLPCWQTLQVIRDGIENANSCPGRMALVDMGQSFAVRIDSANTPDTLNRALDNLRDIPGSRRITLVTGCPRHRQRRGPGDAQVHRTARPLQGRRRLV